LLLKVKTRRWIDISAIVGNSVLPNRDFELAVHLALYWGQEMRNGPICPTSHPPSDLVKILRKGIPATAEEVSRLGQGYWPPPDDAFSLEMLPRSVPNTKVKEGRLQVSVAWDLSDTQLSLRKSSVDGGAEYWTTTEITRGREVGIRQIVETTGRAAHIPGMPAILKLLASTCGLYDGDVPISPRALIVDTEEDVKKFLAILESPTRMQPLVSVSRIESESATEWLNDVVEHARESFGLQHVAGLTPSGLQTLHDLLGYHAPPEGSIKTFRSGFTLLDVVKVHPATLHQTILEHPKGRSGMLARWRKRMMTQDAWERGGPEETVESR
jgi:hypothetical protein